MLGASPLLGQALQQTKTKTITRNTPSLQLPQAYANCMCTIALSSSEPLPDTESQDMACVSGGGCGGDGGDGWDHRGDDFPTKVDLPEEDEDDENDYYARCVLNQNPLFISICVSNALDLTEIAQMPIILV